MPNNLVFNDVAGQLKTQIYGINGSNVTAVAVEPDGKFSFRSLSGTTDSIAISGPVTVTAADLDIRNLSGATDSVSVSGSVTVAATALDIRHLSGATDSVIVSATALDIRPLSGTTDSVAVSGTVTVTAASLDIRHLSAATDSIAVVANAFVSDTAVVSTGTGETVALREDTSQQTMYSFYVKNNDAVNSITAWLEISPADADEYYIPDQSGSVTIPPSGKTVLVAQEFLRWTRLKCNTTATANFEAYYNAH